MRLFEYRPHHASAFLTQLSQELGRHSLAHVRSVMSNIFRLAVRRGRLATNPIREAGSEREAAPPVKTPRNEASRWSAKEITAALQALQNYPTAQLALALGFYAGLRTSEIMGLQWRDIASDCSFLQVSRSCWRGQYTEGGKTHHHENNRSVRPVPIIEPLRSLLLNYRASATAQPELPVLISENLTPLDLHALAKRVIRPVLSQHGLPWKGFYAGRRALSSHLANSGEEGQQAAMEILGHSNIATTRTYYIGPMSGNALSAMTRLETHLQGTIRDSSESDKLQLTDNAARRDGREA